MRVLFLVFILVVGGFGEENDSIGVGSEEIGVPYILDGQIDSATLTPDGKYFYTLKNNVVSFWKLEPLTYINKLDLSQIVEYKLSKTAQLYATKDNFIIFNGLNISLWNMKKKEIINQVDINRSVGTLFDKYFITIDSKNEASTWDINTLTRLKKVNLENVYNYLKDWGWSQSTQLPKRSSPSGIYNFFGNLIYISSHPSHYPSAIITLNSKTLEYKKVFWSVGEYKLNLYITSKNYLELLDVFSINDINNYIKLTNKERLFIRLDSGKIENTPSEKMRSTLEFPYIKNRFSFSENNGLFHISSGKLILYSYTNKQFFFIYQVDEENIILREKHKDDFYATQGAKKFIKMINNKDEIIPINKVTFNLKNLNMQKDEK